MTLVGGFLRCLSRIPRSFRYVPHGPPHPVRPGLRPHRRDRASPRSAPRWSGGGHDPTDRDAFLMVAGGRDAAARPPAGGGHRRGDGPARRPRAPRLPACGTRARSRSRSPPTGWPPCSRDGPVGTPGSTSRPGRSTPSSRTGRCGPGSSTTTRPSRWTAASCTPRPTATLRVLGIFGLRPDRAGLQRRRDGRAAARRARARADGSAALLPGARRRGGRGALLLVGAEELLELGWRTRALASDRRRPAA